jgi:hypothetical protein
VRLDFALLADAASTVEGKIYILGGGVSRVTAPTLPWAQSLAVCLRLIADPDDDLTVEREIEISIIDPSENTILGPVKAAMVGKPPPPADPSMDVELAMLLALTINGIALRSYGPHRIALSVDGAEATLPFVVV